MQNSTDQAKLTYSVRSQDCGHLGGNGRDQRDLWGAGDVLLSHWLRAAGYLESSYNVAWFSF